jgi:hypothetical protein
MKTNKFLLLAAIACGAAFTTSCSNSDNPVGTAAGSVKVVSFENQALNESGYWCGDTTGVAYDNWGSTAYSCFYTEQDVTLTANYTPAWASWSGYAISNRKENTYNAATMTPDQFNNITGKAYSGNNFCVVFTFGEEITFNTPAKVLGFYYTNNAWTVDAILNGDGMTPGKFEAEDWFMCTVTGTKEDNTTASVDIYLAKDGKYVQFWQWADLSSLGKVKSLSFSFSGTKTNDWGVTTPTYICIDDLTYIN